MDLNTTWFLLIGVLLVGYAILDGFDLGVGVLHLFTRDEQERRININAVGPVWDGNEVWLLTAGGAMFAAFPILYATVFSGFYLAFMLLLFALIFRAVSFEFRGQVDCPKWRGVWDWAFGVGSLVPALLYGVAVGNVLHGLPIEADGSLNISFLAMLNPYSLLVGVLSLALFTMHGAAFLAAKTDGAQQERAGKWVTGAWMAVVVLYLGATAATIFVSPYLFEGMLGSPIFWILLIVLLGAIVNIPLAVGAGKFGRAFLSSAAMIFAMVALTGTSLYPRWVPSTVNLDHSLTIYNASSTPRTLMVMLIIALIGLPIVLVYTAFVYRVFWGKVQIAEDSY